MSAPQSMWYFEFGDRFELAMTALAMRAEEPSRSGQVLRWDVVEMAWRWMLGPHEFEEMLTELLVATRIR
jgi:hypothetical protein